jgi:Bacterial nucleoid DNA-binding protein
MNKAELIDAIALNAGLTKVDAKKALDSFIDVTTKAMKENDKVSLVGFGSFAVATRSARKGHNPQTGKAINIPEKSVVRFKPAANLLK